MAKASPTKSKNGQVGLMPNSLPKENKRLLNVESFSKRNSSSLIKPIVLDSPELSKHST